MLISAKILQKFIVITYVLGCPHELKHCSIVTPKLNYTVAEKSSFWQNACKMCNNNIRIKLHT